MRRRSACTTRAPASSRALGAARPGPRRHLRLRADGLHPHPRRQRAAVRRLLAAQALPRARGLRRRRSSSTSPTSTTRSTHAARGAGRPERRAGRRDDRRLHRRHRRARPRPARPRAAGLRDDRRRSSRSSPTLIERGHAYAVDGDVYFRVRSDAGYGALSHRAVDEMDQGEGVEGAARKEDPLDFALWKAQKEGEDTAWDAPWGRGRPGWHIECSAMAEELLGVGFDIHGGGNDLRLPPPRERGRADARRPAARELARIWMHNGMLAARRREDGQVASATSARCTRCSTTSGRDALRHVLLPAATTASRWPSPTSASSRGARARARGSASAARRLADGAVARATCAAAASAFFAALADDFNTPAGAGARCSTWVREANRARAAVGRARPARDARRARPREPARGRRRAAPAPRRVALLERARGGARGAGLRRGRPPARRARRARLGGPRRRRPAPSSCRAGSDRLRPQPGARGAARPGAGAVHARSGRPSAPRASRGSAGARVAVGERRARSSARAAPTPTRASAPRPAATRTSAPRELLAPRPIAFLIVALDEVQDPQNLGAICRTAECAGVDGRGHPRAPRGRGHAGGRARRRRARSSTCAIARVRNLADFLGRGQGRRAAGATAPTPARGAPYDAPTTAAASCSSSAPRARACARAWPKSCDELVALPLRGPHRVAERRAPPRPCCCTGSCSAAAPLDSGSITASTVAAVRVNLRLRAAQ